MTSGYLLLIFSEHMHSISYPLHLEPIAKHLSVSLDRHLHQSCRGLSSLADPYSLLTAAQGFLNPFRLPRVGQILVYSVLMACEAPPGNSHVYS